MIKVSRLEHGSDDIATCARWRVEAFDVLGGSIENEMRGLEALTRDQTSQVALVAHVDGILSGTCLLVTREIEPRHDVSPWLVGLFVVPERRRQGVATALVRATEDEARVRGVRRLHLYATDTAGYYTRLGWVEQDVVDWMGYRTTLMIRDL